ncbi:ATP-dependent RecD-like DNA helicase [Candidatus Sumerlaeota bacterium]|nr:ATP-dependent RecD-like DNA helicase [Candidatus Sumerlaeota bacterium]
MNPSNKKDIHDQPENLLPIDGVIDHYIFQNELNSYSVAIFLEEGKKSRKITVVGTLAGISPGESLRLWGKWVTNPKFGRQFEIQSYIPILPATILGIKRYLGSGMIKGIGNAFAKKIVDHFGVETLDVIDHEPDRLLEIRDIGPKRLDMVKNAWREHRMIRDIMIFLQSHNITLNLATRIFRFYGTDSIRILKEDPYRLSLDMYGIGFKSADKIAQSMGIPKDAPERARAGIIHVLTEAAGNDGHTFLFEEELIKASGEILEIDRDIINSAIEYLQHTERIVKEEINGQRAVFPRSLHACETGITDYLKQLRMEKRQPFLIDVETRIAGFEKKYGFNLAEKQKEAIRCALRKGLVVITGGPGTGKTTIVRALLHLLPVKPEHIKLAAPTGRAAKRLEETTQMEAFTIHRLLKYNPKDGSFQYNEFNPLPLDLLIVDETSMVDVVLAYHLVKAIPRSATVIFVGDADQLPSVGPGNFLKDMIKSGIITVISLDEIFRQAKRSLIVVNAHKINKGEFPIIPKPDSKPLPDFFFIEKKEPEEALDALCKLVKERIPERFQMNPTQDVQVITPMYKGVIGADNLNATLQDLLNPNPDYVIRGSMRLRVGDKVMQLRNNYDKDVYNGDVGVVVSFDREYQIVNVRFEGRVIPYEFKELDDLTLAYAITVHKSQGSEYPAVVIPLLTQHYIMLQRNLIYTAVTRARRLVCVIGTKKALGIAIHNAEPARRNSALGRWLAQGMEGY